MQKKSVHIALICGIAIMICSLAVVWRLITTQFRSTPAIPDEVVIEVKNTSKGLYCFVGELLHMRVSQSGRIDYEVIDSQSGGQVSTCAKSAVKTKEFSREKLETLFKLAMSDEVWNSPNEYAPFAFGTDTQDDMTILLKKDGAEKRIVIHNPYIDDARAKDSYPPGLFALLLESKRIRGYLN